MKKVFVIAILAALIAASGCSKVSVPEISDASMVSEPSEISGTSSVESAASSPSGKIPLTNECKFEVNVATTVDWQSFHDTGNSEKKTFALSFPEIWIRSAEGASTFQDKDTDIKVFESVRAVKLPADFDFAGSFIKENFEDSMRDTSVIGDIKIGKLTAADGEKTYALVIQSVVPGGGGKIQIDRWYPYLYVIMDGDYAYCMQFYSLNDPTSDDKESALFLDIMQTFKAVL